MMKWILFATALYSFVIYGLAIRKVFSREYGVEFPMKLMQIAGLCGAVVHLWRLAVLESENRLAMWLAALTYFMALGVFLSARKAISIHRLSLAFSRDVPKLLVEQGIYRYVRHPFYLAYSLTWLAGVIATPTLWTYVTASAMLVLYWRAAKFEEGKFAASALATEYELYRQRAGMFFPKLP